MGQARASYYGRRSADVADFDRRSRAQSEAQVINVSPFPARWKIATQPGSEPRYYTLEPGETVHLPAGYTIPGKGAGEEDVRPTVESLTELEVWPGEREEGEDNKLVWTTKPGPRLPQVCSVARARGPLADGRPGFAEQWKRALAKRDDMRTAPLKMVMRRGGRSVEVEVEEEEDPRFARRDMPDPGPELPDDVEDLSAPGEGDNEPPPDHDEPLDAVELPRATGPTEPEGPPDAPIPTRARRGGNGGNRGGRE